MKNILIVELEICLIVLPLPSEWFRKPVQTFGLKGNQVQILNSPAAVSSIQPAGKDSCH